MPFTEHRYLSRDGLSLNYRSYGGGHKTVLCLPGLTRNCRDFEDLAPHLADRFRVLTPDLRGRGRSDRDPNWRNYHPGTYVRDLWRLLDQLSIDRVSIIGTSLGGLLANVMAAQRPQRIRAIVLNDIGPEVAPEGARRIAAYVGHLPAVRSWKQAAEQARAINSAALPDQSDELWLRFAQRSYRENENGIPELDSDPMIGAALARSLKAVAFLGWLRRVGIKRKIAGVYIDPWDSFRAVTMPCLVLRGELSDILSQSTLERMQGLKPDLETVQVPGRGHAPLLDEPEALAAIDRFLDQHRPHQNGS
jgi:pimeloyl-ACP methyl ester carboxylesterase